MWIPGVFRTSYAEVKHLLGIPQSSDSMDRATRKPKPANGPKPGQARGFALVITITLMVLLSLLAIGLLSLSSVALRSSSQGSLKAAARANARLSLNIALGELQRQAGPDQRITSSAGVLEDSGLKPARPHLTGVWKGWKWDGSGDPDYEARKNSDFMGWLASAKDPQSLRTPGYAQTPLSDDAVALVDEGSVPDGTGRVHAEAIDIGATNRLAGRYAWAVMDQGQKACVTLPNDNTNSIGSDIAELTSPATPGYGVVANGSHDWSRLEAIGNERLKLISHNQLRLAGFNERSTSFHHLTPVSMGLPVNAAEGGLSKDLSLIFDHSSLPTELDRSFLYSNDIRPLANPSNRLRGANVMPAPDPSWKLIHDHARLHTKVRNADTQPAIDTDVVARPPAGTPASRTLYHRSFSKQQLAPVIAKAQFIFSIGFGASPAQARNQRQLGAKDGEDWILWLLIDPVITLWNPYDVALEFKTARINLHRVPLAFKIFRNGVAPANSPTLFANAFAPDDFRSRAKRYYRLNIEPPLDRTGRAESSIIMKPGEHMVFTAHNHVKHYRQQYMNKGVDLRPGWNQPAGAASNTNVGGVSSLHLCVDSSGQNSGRLNGTNIRSIPVKAGDQIQVEVSNARANIDKFSETNNREITAMLTYHVGSNHQSSSTPPLVGGIELDYGKRESQLLPNFSTRELPIITVPAGLPSSQGDSYVGERPPPNCRWKEPFLIASLHQKTALDSRVPTRGWLQNSPVNLYASSGIDQTEDDDHHQYEFSWEAMTDWTSSPTVEVDGWNRGFGASGIYAQSGQEVAPFASIPLAPLTSIPQLRHAPLNTGGQLPLQTQVVGNSHASPLIPGDRIKSDAEGRTYLDHPFHANQALFDNYFFSSAGSQSGPMFSSSRNLERVIDDFISKGTPLPNPRIQPINRSIDTSELKELTDIEQGFRNFAAQVGIHGSFNVNSTSVAAWQAVLGSLQDPNPVRIDTSSGSVGRTSGSGTLVTRHVPPLDQNPDSTGDIRTAESLLWRGHRRLADDAIERLAVEMVRQVKLRGPFQSVAEFVNRRPENSDLGVKGALQAAIDDSGINDEVLQSADSVANPNAANPGAALGTTADGAPAAITQADLLTPLAPVITVRSDTFLIRSYGEASDGRNTARAWCEATVQRMPEFIDDRTPPTESLASLEPDGANERFGRRFKIIAFRWLTAAEV